MFLRDIIRSRKLFGAVGEAPPPPVDPGETWNLANAKYIGVGNSLMYGYMSETSNSIGNPSYQLLTIAPFNTNGSTQVNLAVPAKTTIELRTSTYWNPVIAEMVSGRPNVCLVWEVTNDLATEARTPQQAVDTMNTFCADLKTAMNTANPGGVNKVVVLTCLPRWQDQGYGLQAYSDKVDASVPLMVNRVSPAWDLLINVRDDIRFNTYNTTNFNADMVHLKDAGYHGIAEDIANGLKIKMGLITSQLAAPTLTSNAIGSTEIDNSLSTPAGINGNTGIIQIATNNTLTAGLKQTDITGTSLNITGLNASTTYYLRGKVNNLSNIISNWSAVKTVTTAAASGGTGSGTFPSSIGNIVARWKADTVTADGSNNVTQLTDLTGNGRHLTQTGTAGVLHTTAGLNSKPFVRMEVGRGYVNNSIAMAQPFTFYHVFKHLGGSGKYVIFNNAATVNINLSATAFSSSVYSVQANAGAANFGFRNTFFATGNAAGAYKFTFSGDESRVQKGLAPESSQGDFLFASPGTSPMQKVGINIDATDVEWYESILYSRDLTVTEERQLANYLAAEYAIPNDQYIAFVGNSITRGEGASGPGTSWAYLTASELGYAINNYGISGAYLHGSGNLTVRGYDSQMQEAISGATNYGKLVICMGYNNDFNKNGTGTTGTKAQWKADFKTPIVDAIAAGYLASDIYIITPMYSKFNYYGSDAEMNEMIAVQHAVATETGVNFGDLNAYTHAHASEFLQPDEIHPNDAGHRKDADYVKSVILGAPIS